jgi:hypothetical protein
MKFTPLGELDLVYVGPMAFVDYGVGGQYYAHMEGHWRGDRLSGKVRLTNLAQKRADNINTPTLRGVLETDDGATMYMEANGLSQIQGGGRVFVNSLTLRTAHPAYQWVNTLLAVVEGELYGQPRPGEMRARCRVYACEPTISSAPPGGDQPMRAIAYVVPVLHGMEATLEAVAAELDARRAEYDEVLRHSGMTREAAFLQWTPQGSQLIVYREFADPHAEKTTGGPWGGWLSDRMSAVLGFDPESAPPPTVELLVRQRPAGHGRLYAAALPVLPDKTARLHEFAIELNGIHASEFEESLRRLGFGLTLFIQHDPALDLIISVVEGDEPADALGKLATSQHPFDRWHVQQIADQTGLDLTAPPPPPNKRLWSLDNAAVAKGATHPT